MLNHFQACFRSKACLIMVELKTKKVFVLPIVTEVHNSSRSWSWFCVSLLFNKLKTYISAIFCAVFDYNILLWLASQGKSEKEKMRLISVELADRGGTVLVRAFVHLVTSGIVSSKIISLYWKYTFYIYQILLPKKMMELVSDSGSDFFFLSSSDIWQFLYAVCFLKALSSLWRRVGGCLPNCLIQPTFKHQTSEIGNKNIPGKKI